MQSSVRVSSAYMSPVARNEGQIILGYKWLSFAEAIANDAPFSIKRTHFIFYTRSVSWRGA